MTTVVTTDVANGQVTDASVINNNFGNVKSVVNGQIDNSNVAAGAAIAVSKLQAGSDTQILRTVSGVPTWDAETAGGSFTMPAGVLVPYGGAAAPVGWLLCDGAAVSRATYADLFTAIGTAYGSGDGSTTFNVPDMQGRAPFGKGTHTEVDALGDNEGALLANRTPSHHHIYASSQNTVVQTSGAAAQASNVNSKTTGNANLQDKPAYLVVNYIIKT